MSGKANTLTNIIFNVFFTRILRWSECSQQKRSYRVVGENKPRQSDWRFRSSLAFTFIILALGGVFGYLMPAFDPTAVEHFPESRNIIWATFVVGYLAYLWIQTLPLATGEVGSTTTVANDGITSMLPYIAVVVVMMLWALVPEFKLSGFMVTQLVLIVLVTTTDVYLNGQIGALVNRLVQEYKSQS